MPDRAVSEPVSTASGNRTPNQERLRRNFGLIRVIGTQFKLFFACTLIAFTASTVMLYNLYPVKELPPHHHSLLGTAYDTLQMIFFQTPIPFVDDWRLAPLFFGLPLLGLVVIAEGVVRLGNLLIQRRMYSREWQKMLAATFENHIVVCGLGNVGFRVVEQLRRFGENVVCIESNADGIFLGELEQLETPVLIGDVRNTQVLEDASIRKAKALLAVTDNDLANLECALNAREMSPGIRIVIRMFDQKLAKKIEKSLGINCAFSASALSAPVFAQAAISGDILSSFEFGGTVVSAMQLVMKSTSLLVGMQIDDVRQKYEVTVLMHERNGAVDWNPPPMTQLQANDKLLLIADTTSIHTLVRSEKK